MLKDYLELGQIVSTHGVRGEIRLQPWCDSPEFACRFKTVYFDADGEKPVRVASSRPHGNVALMKLEGVDTVEQAQALRGRVLHVSRKDVRLPDGSYFIADLIGCGVFDADEPEKKYGEITQVSSTGANDVWHVRDPKGVERLLPAVPAFVIDTDVSAGRVLVRPIKGIFDDAD